MKLKLLTFFVLCSLTVVPSVFAQTSTPFSRREEKRIEIREQLAVKQAEIRQRLTAVRRERIRNYFGKMIVRLEATIERLEKLITRIEARIKIIKDKNEEINTTEVEKTVSEAKATIVKAKTELANLKTNLETMLESDDPKTSFKNVRESLKTVITFIKDTHKLLVQTIGDIKGLRVGDTDNEE